MDQHTKEFEQKEAAAERTTSHLKKIQIEADSLERAVLNFEHGSLAEVRNRFQEAGNSRAAAEVKCTQEEKNQKTWEGELETLLKQQATNRAEIEELLAAKAEALKQVQRNWESAASMVDEGDVLTSEGTSERLKREHDDQDNVQRWLELEQAWLEATSNTSAMESGRQLLRAANLICATTVAIGSHPMISGTKNEKGERKAGEWSEFDTLIVDEASRVTDAEFLIGAVRSRRWILVGDEHQLPPYVEQDEEHFLHALVALRMVEQGDAPDAKERSRTTRILVGGGRGVAPVPAKECAEAGCGVAGSNFP